MAVWNSLKNTVDEALRLPEGSFAADFGFLVEQSVSPDTVLEVVTELQEKQIDITVASQSGILVKAKEKGLLESWTRLVLL
jgi:hypothetical protein